MTEDPRNLLNSMAVSVIATGLDLVIRYWNSFSEQLYGWSLCESFGQNIVELIMPSERETTDLVLALMSGETAAGEFVVRRKGGMQLTVLLFGSPLYNEDGARIGIVVVSHDLTAERKYMEEQVRSRTERLRVLSQRLIHAQDDERRKIARELHDGVGQSLAILKMTLGSVSDAAGRVRPDVVEDIRTIATNCIIDVRTLSYLLHPPQLESIGLITAIQWLVEGFAQRSGIQVRCQVGILPRLPSALETAIYRILQEALANVLRHSGSSTADVELSAEVDTLALKVRDFGHGISENVLEDIRGGKTRTGVGLAGICERVEEFGGTFDLLSDRSGTTLAANFPISGHLTADESSRSASA